MSIISKPLFTLLAFFFVLIWTSTCYSRTYRNCTSEVYFLVEQVEIDDVYTDLSPPIRLNAGNLVFRGSAPTGSPNKARMRASKTAEKCINNWYHGENCSKARSTSYGDDFGSIDIRTLMTRSICTDLNNQGRTDLMGRLLRGKLYGRIDGDRCCKDSAKGCPYNYGQSRAGRFNDSGLAGRELWDLHYERCFQVMEIVIPPDLQERE
ncbi:hypothetical protein [Sulfuriflexus mobilis]|uniref:hypothetical protein n=1 Tax=Sulfuriflexus mobilis TaxID=1811807 RepID=UPI000F848C05|nr:hypothetical protein [Sulfuriflexus mobilis]